MKNKQKVAELIAALKAEAETPHDFATIEDFEHAINESPRVTIIDDNHQEFLGKVYTKDRNNYYTYRESLHVAVMKHYFGDIPKGMHIHHNSKDEFGNFDSSKNNVEDLLILTPNEHVAIHT